MRFGDLDRRRMRNSGEKRKQQMALTSFFNEIKGHAQEKRSY
jgi:hypothetical protein